MRPMTDLSGAREASEPADDGVAALPVTGHAAIDAALAGLELDDDVATHPAAIAEVLEVVGQALNPTGQAPLPR